MPSQTRFAAHPELEVLLDQAEAEGRSVLLEPEVYALLAAAGIDVPAHRFVVAPDEVDEELCAALASRPGGREGRLARHPAQERRRRRRRLPERRRADARGGAAGAGAARDAAAAGAIRGALVAERVRFRRGFGREILAGFRHDPAFGPVGRAGRRRPRHRVPARRAAPGAGRAVRAAPAARSEAGARDPARRPSCTRRSAAGCAARAVRASPNAASCGSSWPSPAWRVARPDFAPAGGLGPRGAGGQPLRGHARRTPGGAGRPGAPPSPGAAAARRDRSSACAICSRRRARS